MQEKEGTKLMALWESESDDGLNKFLKLCLYILYGYGLYVVINELYKMVF